MALPTRTITGNLYTPSGAVVVAGKISAYLLPAGTTVLDDTTFLPVKASSRIEGNITASGVTSLVITVLDSANPDDGYYQVRFELHTPLRETWWEIWRILGIGGGDLALGDIVPAQYGPYLPQASYAPIGFVTPTAGPAGAPGASEPTIVTSLPTGTSSLKSGLYYHDRSANAMGDALYEVGRTGAGSIVLVPIWDLEA